MPESETSKAFCDSLQIKHDKPVAMDHSLQWRRRAAENVFKEEKDVGVK